MTQRNEKMVHMNDKVVHPNQNVVRSNVPSCRPSLLGSKRNFVPPQLLARARGQMVADMYSSKRKAATNSLIGVEADSISSKKQAAIKSFVGSSRNIFKSIPAQNNQSRGLHTRYDSYDDVDVDGTSFDPLFAPPRRNNVEAWDSSSESGHEENNGDELHSSPEDEDLHFEHSNGHADDGQRHEANEDIAKQDFGNRIESSQTTQRDVNGNALPFNLLSN